MMSNHIPKGLLGKAGSDLKVDQHSIGPHRRSKFCLKGPALLRLSGGDWACGAATISKKLSHILIWKSWDQLLAQELADSIRSDLATEKQRFDRRQWARAVDLMINTAIGEDNAISTILHAMYRVQQGKR
jgi:hypothetical protein